MEPEQLSKKLFQYLLDTMQLKKYCDAIEKSYLHIIPNLSPKELDWLVGTVWREGLSKDARCKLRKSIDPESKRNPAWQPNFSVFRTTDIISKFAEIYADDTGVTRQMREGVLVMMIEEFMKEYRVDKAAVKGRARDYGPPLGDAVQIIRMRSVVDEVDQQESVSQTAPNLLPDSFPIAGATAGSRSRPSATQTFTTRTSHPTPSSGLTAALNPRGPAAAAAISYEQTSAPSPYGQIVAYPRPSTHPSRTNQAPISAPDPYLPPPRPTYVTAPTASSATSQSTQQDQPRPDEQLARTTRTDRKPRDRRPSELSQERLRGCSQGRSRGKSAGKPTWKRDDKDNRSRSPAPEGGRRQEGRKPDEGVWGRR